MSRTAKVRASAVALSAAVMATLPTLSGVAQAAFGCGAVITQSTVLTHDIGPCKNGGVTIAADNVVLDLNGHRIFGIPAQFDGAGVLFDNVRNSTVRNGTVAHFDGGVVIDRGQGNTVESIFAHDNIGEFTQGFLTDYGDGILVLHSSQNRVRPTEPDHNGPFSGITVLGDSHSNVIENNVSQNNNLRSARPGHGGGFDIQEDDGIRLENFFSPATGLLAPSRNIVRNNTVRNNGLDGIALFAGVNDNQILNNVVEGNGFAPLPVDNRKGDGIHLFPRATRNVVSGNRVTGNARSGIIIDATLSFPVANRIVRNVSVNNAADPGFDLAWDMEDRNRFCANNVWSQNRFLTRNNPGAPCIN